MSSIKPALQPGAAEPNGNTSTLAPEVSAARVTKLDSRKLFAGLRELMIEHEGAIYRLRHTRSGKLILTK